MQLEKIGKYKIVGKIGQGAMGEVYKAHDAVLNRFVAIKTIAGTLGSDEQFRKRFHREAQSAAQLNHRNIVTIFEFSDERGMVYMVMELLEGTDLKDLIVKKASLRLEDKLSIIEQMCDGLAYAHERGVVHRDLKPANIHVLPNGTVKIMDFGLARLGVSEITRTGTVMGTPNYMSPEQVRGEKVDSRSDIFSVGAVMYELLAGHKPFEAETMHSVLFQVLDQEPQPLRKWIPEMPLPVAHVVEKALAKDPRVRYQSAGDMRGGLRNARRVMAAGRAAAAALAGPAAEPEAEATMTRVPAVPATFVSTDHRDWGVTGATALSLAPAKESDAPTTERPDPTILEPFADEPAQSRTPVYAVGALVAVLALGAAGFVWMRSGQGPAINPAELAREQEAIIREQLVAGQLELAQAELANKSYAGAVAQADKVLGLDATSQAAADIKRRAQLAMQEVETAAGRARGAFAKGDTAEATQALQRLMVLDPSHAAVTELSAALNRHFQGQANDARTAAQSARAEAVRLRATAFEGFTAGERLVAVADTKLQASNFAEATQKYIEASDGFGRARRAAEAAEAAARRAAIAPSTAPSTSRPSTSPSTAASLFPSAPPVPSLSPSIVPTPSVAVASPPPASLPPSPSTGAVAAGTAGADASIRRVLAEYARAVETKDMVLFKTVWPGLSADQEKALRESFKNVKSQQVAVSIEAVDVKGPAAAVRISRQDTINGQQQKARQQTVRMTQRAGGWVIEGFGQ